MPCSVVIISLSERLLMNCPRNNVFHINETFIDHSKKCTPISLNILYSSNELHFRNIPEKILRIGWPMAEQ